MCDLSSAYCDGSKECTAPVHSFFPWLWDSRILWLKILFWRTLKGYVIVNGIFHGYLSWPCPWREAMLRVVVYGGDVSWLCEGTKSSRTMGFVRFLSHVLKNSQGTENSIWRLHSPQPGQWPNTPHDWKALNYGEKGLQHHNLLRATKFGARICKWATTAQYIEQQ
jgi:hypothetical protein